MNQIISAPAAAVKQLTPCPVCCGPRSHPDQPPGQVWDFFADRPVECWECDGAGQLTTDELADLARETQDADLAALVLERDPALTLAELGFDDIDPLYGDLPEETRQAFEGVGA